MITVRSKGDRWRDAEITSLRRLAQHFTSKQLAPCYGVAPSTLQAFASKHKIRWRKKNSNFRLDMLPEIERRYCAGEHITGLAKSYRISPKTLRREIDLVRLEDPSRFVVPDRFRVKGTRWTVADKARFMEVVARCSSLAEVASACGLSRSQAGDVAAAFGIRNPYGHCQRLPDDKCAKIERLCAKGLSRAAACRIVGVNVYSYSHKLIRERRRAAAQDASSVLEPPASESEPATRALTGPQHSECTPWEPKLQEAAN